MFAEEFAILHKHFDPFGRFTAKNYSIQRSQ